MTIIQTLIEKTYYILWGDWIHFSLPGGIQLQIPLLALLLFPTGIWFTLRTRFLQLRLLPDMLRAFTEKKQDLANGRSLSSLQALIVSTATRVGMGNLVCVVAAISAGGAGALFWMWITALLGAATAFIEATLAQLHKQTDPLYGGYRGGPAYYIHDWIGSLYASHAKSSRDCAPTPLQTDKVLPKAAVSAAAKATTAGPKLPLAGKSILASLFALSGLICWCGISQVISNSVASSFQNAFHIPPLYTTIILVVLAAIIVLRKNATVKVLDILVPIMAAIYTLLTLILILLNVKELGSVFLRIFEEAFGLRQAVAGGFGTILMNGVKRGLFSNEAGSGSAPCAAATAEASHPAKVGLMQAMGVFIDTLLCTCTAMIMLLTPSGLLEEFSGMDFLQEAMRFHLGEFGVIFIALILWLFSFTTFIGILFYARSNIAYLFGDRWSAQTAYKIFALVMLFVGGLATYTLVWDLGDVGIGLMTIFNLIALFPLSGEALASLKDYETSSKAAKKD